MSTPNAPTPDQCRCKVVGWTRDPAEPHIPAQPAWEQADDCPVHPLTAAPAPNAADEREALVKVAVLAVHHIEAQLPDPSPEQYARAVLDAVADRLVAPLNARLAEVEAAFRGATTQSGGWERLYRDEQARAERAEAALVAAEQRSGIKALREAAEAADRSVVTGLEKTRPDRVARWLRARADRLTTQATNEEEG